MKHFDVALILPESLGDHSISILSNTCVLSDNVIHESPPIVDFVPNEKENLSRLMLDWARQLPDSASFDKGYLSLFAGRGIFHKALPEDFYANKLPEGSTLPRGKCRKPIKLNLCPNKTGMNHTESSSKLEVEMTFST